MEKTQVITQLIRVKNNLVKENQDIETSKTKPLLTFYAISDMSRMAKNAARIGQLEAILNSLGADGNLESIVKSYAKSLALLAKSASVNGYAVNIDLEAIAENYELLLGLAE